MLRLTYVIVVCVASMCVCVSGQSLSRDYGVKLCGREFIRAVIFTCGGSRWKRSLDEDLDPFQVSSYSDLTEGKGSLSWQHGLELSAAETPLQLPSSTSLADLLSLLGGLGDHRQAAVDTGSNEGFQQTLVLGGDRTRIPAINWPRPSANRRKRNFSVGVAGMCCNQGCTKNDIGRLC